MEPLLQKRKHLHPADECDPVPLPLSIALLPIELLMEIFSLLSFSPRLRVVSRVCRTWRRAVLRSITEIPDGSNFDNAVHILPSLQTIKLHGRAPPQVFPPALRSLGVPKLQDYGSDMRLLRALALAIANSPSLTDLTLELRPASEAALELINFCSASLRKLSLELVPQYYVKFEPSDVIRIMESVNAPRLESLSLCCEGQFVLPRMSTLLSLSSLSHLATSLPLDVTPADLPRLTSLEYLAPLSNTAPQFLIQFATHVRSLKVEITASTPVNIDPVVLNNATEISFPMGSNLCGIAQFGKLQRLYCPQLPLNDCMYEAFHMKLASLQGSESFLLPVFRKYGMWPVLQDLRIHSDTLTVNEDIPLPGVLFPALTVLCVTFPTEIIVVDGLINILHAATRLQTLKLCLGGVMRKRDAVSANLKRLLEVATLRAVDVIELDRWDVFGTDILDYDNTRMWTRIRKTL